MENHFKNVNVAFDNKYNSIVTDFFEFKSIFRFVNFWRFNIQGHWCPYHKQEGFCTDCWYAEFNKSMPKSFYGWYRIIVKRAESAEQHLNLTFLPKSAAKDTGVPGQKYGQ
jgi:hypothetical protein